MATNTVPVEQQFVEACRAMQTTLFKTHVRKGWTKRSRPKDRVWQGNQIALMHAELSEAHEAIRKDLLDDKLTTRKGVEVELADVVIRIMNFATECKLDLAGALIEKAAFNKGRPYMHGGKKF